MYPNNSHRRPYPMETFKCPHALTSWTFSKLNNGLSQVVTMFKKSWHQSKLFRRKSISKFSGGLSYIWVVRVYRKFLKKYHKYTRRTSTWPILWILQRSFNWWVIQYKSTEKHMTFFGGDFWPKKSKVFNILVIKFFFG